MPDYTEDQIRELTGCELWKATHEICGIPRDRYVASLDVCVPLLMGPGRPLASWSLRYGAGGWDIRGCEADDPATAICRAACIVAMRQKETNDANN